jgi:hypothetical protein
MRISPASLEEFSIADMLSETITLLAAVIGDACKLLKMSS